MSTKELYKERYEFTKFMEFSGFYFDFSGLFLDFLDLILLKKWGKSWGENHGIVSHLNRVISAIESSFSELDGPRFLR